MGKELKKKIVISAVNFTEGGPLTILNSCLSYLSKDLSSEYEVVALVNSKKMFDMPNIEYIEFPLSKRSWLFRLYYEYYYFKKLSDKLKPHLWLSLHDMTPNVTADIRAVYCHNPSPFYTLTLKELILEPKFALFNMFYKFLYSINIKKNSFVVVQQNWLRESFERIFGVKNVIVAYASDPTEPKSVPSIGKEKGTFKFIYPAFPRVFKNVELACEAFKLLEENGITTCKLYLTIDGTENRYSRYIHRKYSKLTNIIFLGNLKKEELYKFYGESDCLIFPSKLETWGLPISEFKMFNKPILAANLPYARETVGNYDKVKFFSPNDPKELFEDIMGFSNGVKIFGKNTMPFPAQPFSRDWRELFGIMLRER
ncbi:MAG: glycosyltransferase [bacterium]